MPEFKHKKVEGMTKRTRWISVLAGLMLVSAGRQAASGSATPDLPGVTVPVCAMPPYLDGILTDACWQAAAVISNITGFTTPDAATGHTARLTQDGQWLYIAVEVVHPAPKHIKQTVFEADGRVINDDSIEIFLDPGSSNTFYMYYCLNAANIKSDAVVKRDGSRNYSVQTPWRSAAVLTKQGWNTELAFPLFILTDQQKRHAGDWSKARINICVNIIKPIFDAYGARMSEEKQSLSWAPVTTGFHQPERFGWLHGVCPASSNEPLNPLTAPLFYSILVNARPGRYQTKAGQAGYTIVATLKNTSSSTGMATMVVWDQPAAGTAGETRQNQPVGINEDKEVILNVLSETPGQRSAVIWLNDAIHGGAFDSRLLNEQDMQVTDTFSAWLDRSFYTTESVAQAICRLRVPESSFAGQSIVVKDNTGRIVGRLERLTADCRAPIALDRFGLGQHPLTVEWLGTDGGRLGTQSVALIKLSPRPGCEVKIDKVNNVLLKDGQAVFPFGLCVYGLTSQDDVWIRRYATAGYNTLLWARPADIPLDEMRDRLAVAQSNGLMVMDWVTGILPVPPGDSDARKSRGLKVYDRQSFSTEEEIQIARDDFTRFLPGLRASWAVCGNTPNLIAYYGADEPNLVNPDARIAMVEDFYRELKQVDSYRPVLAVYACHIPPGALWTRWSDVLAYDPYIYPGWGRLSYGAPNFVAQQTIELKRRADSVHQAAWILPVTWQLDPDRMPRGITPDEQNCQTYLALIHGAKGLLYFVNTTLHAQVGWDAISRLAQQMKALGPAITAPYVPQEIIYQPTPLDADKGVFPDVQAALFRYPDGRCILLAANSADCPVTGVFTVAGLRASGFWGKLLGRCAARDLFGGKTHIVQDETFSDELESYGVRAYVLGIDQFPVRITVQSRRHASEMAGARPFPTGAIAQRKNKMPNPSVEIMSFPGLPDYMMPYRYTHWPLVGVPGATWGVETNNPYHGRQCLKISHRNTICVFYPRMTKEPAPYTFSVYARASRDGVETPGVYFFGMTPRQPKGKWILTREWKRYSFTGDLTYRQWKDKWFYLYASSNNEVSVYMDAMQIEEGDTATPFTTE